MISFLENKKDFALLLTTLIVIEIFCFSAIPGIEAPKTGLNLTTTYHFVIFFLLNFFILISVIGKKKIKIKYILFSIIISIIFAILDEIHQLFVPMRLATIKDVLIDSLGIFISTLVYTYIKSKN